MFGERILFAGLSRLDPVHQLIALAGVQIEADLSQEPALAGAVELDRDGIQPAHPLEVEIDIHHLPAAPGDLCLFIPVTQGGLGGVVEMVRHVGRGREGVTEPLNRLGRSAPSPDAPQ